MGLSLKDAKEETVVKLDAPESAVKDSLENCFVGSFFTMSVVNFQSMKAMLANVWHPIGGITITDISDGRYLFRLYDKVGVDHIELGPPGILIPIYQ